MSVASVTPAFAKRCSTDAAAARATSEASTRSSDGGPPRAMSRNRRTICWMRSACFKMVCARRAPRARRRRRASRSCSARPDDDAQRRGHLVGDPHRERPHGRDALRLRERLLSDALRLRDRQLARQRELSPCFRSAIPPNSEHQARRDEDAEQQPPSARFSRSRSRAALATAATPQRPSPPASTCARPAMAVRAGRPTCAASGRLSRTAVSPRSSAACSGGERRRPSIARSDVSSGAASSTVNSPARPAPGSRSRRSPTRTPRSTWRPSARGTVSRSRDPSWTDATGAPERERSPGHSAPRPRPVPRSPMSSASRSRVVRRARSVAARLDARTVCSVSRSRSAASASRCSSHQASPVTTAMATEHRRDEGPLLRRAGLAGRRRVDTRRMHRQRARQRKAHATQATSGASRSPGEGAATARTAAPRGEGIIPGRPGKSPMRERARGPNDSARGRRARAWHESCSCAIRAIHGAPAASFCFVSPARRARCSLSATAPTRADRRRQPEAPPPLDAPAADAVDDHGRGARLRARAPAGHPRGARPRGGAHGGGEDPERAVAADRRRHGQIFAMTANNTTATYVQPRVHGPAAHRRDPGDGDRELLSVRVDARRRRALAGGLRLRAHRRRSARPPTRWSTSRSTGRTPMRLDIDFGVEEAFFSVFAAKAVVKASDDAYERSRVHRDLARRGVDSGLRSPIELTRAEADSSRFDVGRVRARGGSPSPRACSSAAIGAPDAAIDVAGEAPRPADMPALPEALALAQQRDPRLAETTRASSRPPKSTRAPWAPSSVPTCLLTATSRAGRGAPAVLGAGAERRRMGAERPELGRGAGAVVAALRRDHRARRNAARSTEQVRRDEIDVAARAGGGPVRKTYVQVQVANTRARRARERGHRGARELRPGRRAVPRRHRQRRRAGRRRGPPHRRRDPARARAVRARARARRPSGAPSRRDSDPDRDDRPSTPARDGAALGRPSAARRSLPVSSLGGRRLLASAACSCGGPSRRSTRSRWPRRPSP